MAARAVAARVLEQLQVDHALEADTVVAPQSVGGVTHVPKDLAEALVLQNRLEREAKDGAGRKGLVAEQLDVDDVNLRVRIGADGDEREVALAAEAVAVELDVEAGGRADGGEKGPQAPETGDDLGLWRHKCSSRD